MIQLLVNGNPLDLPQDLRIDFKKSNILFAFDNISFERTTSISLPKTTNNLVLFGFANDLHTYGQQMRVAVPADMYMGVVVKSGYLYVNSFSYSKNEFNCVFVTGEFIGLRALKELGKATDAIDTYAYTKWNVVNDFAATYPIFHTFYQHSKEKVNKPSYYIGNLLTNMLTQAGIACEQYPINNLEVVLGDPKPIQAVEATITQTVLNPNPLTSSQDPVKYNNIALSGYAAPAFKPIYDSGGYTFEPVVVFGIDRYYYPTYLECEMNIKMTFPTDFGAEFFLYGKRGTQGEMTFYGDYSFEDNNGVLTYQGTPLNGRTVELKKGDAFIIVSPNDYTHTNNTIGFYPNLISTSVFNGIIIEGYDDFEDGDVILLRDNLPDISAIDILKIYAYLDGKVLWYNSEENKIYFEQLNYNSYPIVYIDGKVISRDSIERKFGDYAQNNLIEYAESEDITGVLRLILNYPIDNKTIEDENVLYTIPFSEGRQFGESMQLYMGDSDTIAYSSLNRRLYRTSLTRNTNLQSILNVSTAIEVKSKMTLFEFQQIKDKCRIGYDGAEWVWTDAQWSDGVATLSLSKIK